MTGESYDVLFQDPEGKPIARKNQKYPEAPPTRLLSMTLNLCYWLGYHDADKGHELHKEKEGGIGALDRIDKPTKWRILNQVLTMLMPKLKRQPESIQAVIM